MRQVCLGNLRFEMDAITAISTAQPAFPAATAAAALAANYGLQGTLLALVSERDQNFRVTTAGGQQFVFKIGNSTEDPVTTDFQIRALLHIESRNCPLPTPVIRRTLAGDVAMQLSHDGATHICRVVSFVPGELLSSEAKGPQVAANLGRAAAQLDLALADFAHPGESQTLLWDMQRSDRLRELLPCIEEDDLRTRVCRCIDDFETRVQAELPGLRRQVIHADLHGDNVLVRQGDRAAIAGVIDFGDMLRAPLIMEVAIAAAYLRSIDGDALRLIAPFIAAYDRVIALREIELALLFDLVRARLAATISILRWHLAARGAGDQYAREYAQSERGAETFLERLDELGRDAFTQRVRNCRKD